MAAYTSSLGPFQYKLNPCELDIIGPLFDPVAHGRNDVTDTTLILKADYFPNTVLCPDLTAAANTYADVFVNFIDLQLYPSGSPETDFSLFGNDFDPFLVNTMPTLSTDPTATVGEYIFRYQVGLAKENLVEF